MVRGRPLPAAVQHDKASGWGLDGFKLRALFAVPNADDRRFFYGANFEFSINAHRWDTTHFTSEIRPIIGWHLKPWDIIVNPIVDTAYDGLKNLEFVPAARVAYNFRPAGRWRPRSTPTSARSTPSRPSRAGAPAVRRCRSQLEGLGDRGRCRRRADRRDGPADAQADSRARSQHAATARPASPAPARP